MDASAIERGIVRLAALVKEANSIAVLTGAGISVPSGIPDFRSASGIYSNRERGNVFDLETFRRNPEQYYDFARRFYPMIRFADPNPAHKVLADWENQGKDVCVVTQNIDDLHERAGSSNVCYVHGQVGISSCPLCHYECKTLDLESTIDAGEIPRCSCGGVLKPQVTFFGESLPQDAWERSLAAFSTADLIVVIGTSLVVFPAAALPAERKPGAKLAIVNREPLALEGEAEAVIGGDIAVAFASLREEMRRG